MILERPRPAALVPQLPAAPQLLQTIWLAPSSAIPRERSTLANASASHDGFGATCSWTTIPSRSLRGAG